MAERHEYEEVDKIKQTRNRISDLTDQLANEQPVISFLKENPGSSIIIMLLIGILTAILSRGFIKVILFILKFGLKIITFAYFIKQAGSIFRVFKRKK